MAATWNKIAFETDVITKAVLTEQGDVIYASGASTPAALAHGTLGDILKSGGHGANPAWLTPDGTTGGVNASITPFTSGGHYTHCNAADPHAGYVLESLFDAYTMLMATTDNTPIAITISEQQVVGRITAGAIKGLSVAELQTMIFGTALASVFQLGENYDIALDPALSADGKYCGICETGTAGETLVFGNLVYFKAADSKWWKADANAAATSQVKLAICVLAANADAATKVMLWGKVNAAALYPALTVGAAVYAGETGGNIQVTPPTTAPATDSIIVIGWANTADELFFSPHPVFSDVNLTFADVTTNNAGTTRHGLLLKATDPGTANFINVPGLGNGETIYKMIQLFDNTNPANCGSVAAGTSVIAARRDHIHALPTGTTPAAHAASHKNSGSDELLLSDLGEATAAVAFLGQQATDLIVHTVANSAGRPTAVLGKICWQTDTLALYACVAV